jgi:hypothetical protein
MLPGPFIPPPPPNRLLAPGDSVPPSGVRFENIDPIELLKLLKLFKLTLVYGLL